MFLPKPSEGGNYTPPPVGTHSAICIAFIDLGTQKGEYMGEAKHRREVIIQWELPMEMMPDGRPFVVSKRYTWSMSEKATLRKHLAAWRGKDFTDEDFGGEKPFDTKNILGAACTLNISEKTLPDGKARTFVSSVGQKMKGIDLPARFNNTTYLALSEDRFEPEAFGGLSDRLKEIIAGSPEYQEVTSNTHGQPPAHHGLDDDIPF